MTYYENILPLALAFLDLLYERDAVMEKGSYIKSRQVVHI